MITPNTIAVAHSLMEGLNCARSLMVSMLIKSGEWEQLANLSCSPSDYNNSEDFWAANQATSFLKKNEDLPTNADLEALAVKTFFENEAMCYSANRRLDPYVENGLDSSDPNTWAISSFLERARKVVLTILGHGPGSAYEGRFGPGATMSDSSRECTIPHKMSSVPSITMGAWPFVRSWSETRWADHHRTLKVVRGNSFFTVPKSATQLRGCAKEPAINGFFQLGLGRVMKRKLRGWGLDLQNAEMKHASLACQGSIDDSYATIDLSSASDTVCFNLVRLLLPAQWFEAMCALRSPMTRVKGKWVMLEKFSSMGNGFTFELETVVFASIVKALHPELRPGVDLLVYGDDIIVPGSLSSSVISALNFFGFKVNQKKTFSSGYFRESCGHDYFNGVRVRPFYLKNDVYEPQHYITLANGLRRSSNTLSGNSNRFVLLRNAWFRTLDCLPVHVRRLRGPEELGDLLIHDEPVRWSVRWRSSIRYFGVYRPARYRQIPFGSFDSAVQFASCLYLMSVDRSKGVTPRDSAGKVLHRPQAVIPRDAVSGYKIGWVPHS